MSAEIDLFGSTSMDTMAHGWATAFKEFHPKANVVISAEGSETIFKRLAANPAGIGMMSSLVTDSDLEKLKQSGLKNPVAIMVAREPLGVFVHRDNPLTSISYEQLVSIFAAEGESAITQWGSLGAVGSLANEPIELLGRDESSGTHLFLKNWVFAKLPMRTSKQNFPSNAEVVKAVAESPRGIAICGLKCGSHSAKPLHLRNKSKLYADDDHAILVGGYPLIRPLTLVLDLGQVSEQALASREFAKFSLSQAGQKRAIIAGFFPFDPPTLHSQALKLSEPQGVASDNLKTDK